MHNQNVEGEGSLIYDLQGSLRGRLLLEPLSRNQLLLPFPRQDSHNYLQ